MIMDLLNVNCVCNTAVVFMDRHYETITQEMS